MKALFIIIMSNLIAVIPVAAASLYDRLGGTEGLQTISDQLIDKTAADPASQRTFKKINRPRLKHLLAEQLCQLTGGPCQYSGDNMQLVHRGLNISEAEFYIMVDHLRQILDERGIAQADKNALLALLAPMKRDIVQVSP